MLPTGVKESLIGEAFFLAEPCRRGRPLSVDVLGQWGEWHVKCTLPLDPIALGTLSCPWEHV